MIISIFTFFYWRYMGKKWYYFVFFIINFLALIMTVSRGSILAIIVAFLFYFMELFGIKKIIRFGIHLIILIIFLFFLFKGYKKWQELGKPINVPASANVYFNIQKNYSFFSDVFLGKKIKFRFHTIIVRLVYLYPVAIDDFFSSPIIGIGFSRYEDTPYKFVGIKHFIMLNVSDKVRHSDSHAHNSFLHILAETGIVGLVLFFLIFKEILRIGNNFLNKKRYFEYFFIKYGLISIIYSGFTEHRWTTPSEVLPYVLFLVFMGVYYVVLNENMKN